MNELVQQFGGDLFILGVPCDNFARQEPGANEVLLNCYKHIAPGGGFEPLYNISQKQDVNGLFEHGIYTYLKEACPPTTFNKGEPSNFYWSPVDIRDINWNFEKFLIDTTGKPYRRYNSAIDPTSVEFKGDIQTLIDEGKRLRKAEEMIPKPVRNLKKPSLKDVIGEKVQKNEE